jgi:hypothetical protein
MEATAHGALELAQRLERGEIETFPCCPFPLPTAEDLAFLRTQRARGSTHKDISLNPARHFVTGFRHETPTQVARLYRVLRDFSQNATAWLASQLPQYTRSWQPDRVTFRSEEEATRKLRLTARNDLLHFDAFPSRPTRGWRILRLFVNVNVADPRIWVTSSTFGQVFATYGTAAGLPTKSPIGWARRLGQGMVRLLQPGARARTAYDSYMLRLHHYLKTCDAFQERAPRRLTHFPPGSAWLLLTDAVSHAELRGQFALEQSFFIAPETLALPAESPLALLEAACGAPILPRVA